MVRDIHRAMPGVPVLVVDDCSDDGTADVARAAGVLGREPAADRRSTSAGANPAAALMEA